MGILDDVKGSINKGIAQAGRGTKSITLKAQITEMNKSRREALANLGEALYAETRNDNAFAGKYAAEYQAVAQVDKQIEALQAELAEIEKQANLSAGDPTAPRCPNCGAPVNAADAFCMGCGQPIDHEAIAAAAAAAAEAAAAGPHCAHCGAPLQEGAAFCMNCGKPAEAAAVEAAANEAPAEPEPEAEVEPVIEVEPEAEPAPAGEEEIPTTAEQEWGAIPGPAFAPEPIMEPAAEAEVEPEAEAEVEPEPEAAVEPEPAPAADLEPAAQAEPAPAAMPAPAASTEEAQPAATLCRECGHKINPGARFCRNCGAPVQ